MGTWSAAGSSSCTNCSLGFYASGAAVSCARCGAGLTTPATGAKGREDCVACGPDTWNDGSGDGECGVCVYPATTEGLVTGCRLCSPGEWLPAAGAGCAVCPAGGSCAGGASVPVAQPGWAPNPATVGGVSSQEAMFLRCEPTVACAGGGACAVGYGGSLCEVCVNGFERIENSGECEACPPWVVIAIIVAVVVGVFLAVGLVYLARHNTSYISSIAVFVNFVQVLVLLSSFELSWPPWLLSVFAALSFANVDLRLFSAGCVVGDSRTSYMTLWGLKLSLPFVFLSIIGVGWGLTRAYAAARPKFNDLRRPWLGSHLPRVAPGALVSLERAAVNALTSVFFLLYLMLVSTATEAFICADSAIGTSVLAAEPSIVCSSKSGPWSSLVGTGLVFFIFYGAGIPLLSLFILYRRRHSLWKAKNVQASRPRPRVAEWACKLGLGRAVSGPSSHFVLGVVAIVW